jgi:hypothetical protein
MLLGLGVMLKVPGVLLLVEVQHSPAICYMLL